MGNDNLPLKKMGRPKSISAIRIIDNIRNGWSWIDMMVEYGVTIEMLKDEVENCSLLSEEDKLLAKRFDCILGKEHKSPKLKKIMKNRDYDKLPHEALVYMERLADDSTAPKEENTSLDNSSGASVEERREESEMARKKRDAMIEAVDGQDIKLNLTLQKLQGEIEDIQNRISTKKADNESKQHEIQRIESLQVDYQTQIDSYNEKIASLQGEIVCLGNQKVKIQKQVSRNDKAIGILEEKHKQKQLEVQELTTIQVFLNEDGSFSSPKYSAPNEEVLLLAANFSIRDEFGDFKANDIKLLALILLGIEKIVTANKNFEVVFEKIPEQLHDPIETFLIGLRSRKE